MVRIELRASPSRARDPGMPDAAWRCPRGCDPCVHFDAALRKDIVDDMLHKYGFDFKEAHRPTIIDPAPIVITAPMMIER